MSLMEWRDEFRIGIAEVDDEHRALVELINELHAEALNHERAEHIAAALGEIGARIAAHFALEEKNMTALDYDDRATHKADHEHLLDDIVDITDEVHATGRYEAEALSARLEEWFGRHFRSHDAALHRWLEARK